MALRCPARCQFQVGNRPQGIGVLCQRNLSGHQVHWIEKNSEFNFDIIYVPGSENVVADALSQMYSADSGHSLSKNQIYCMIMTNSSGLGVHDRF